MTIRQLRQRDFLRASILAKMHLGIAGDEHKAGAPASPGTARGEISELPRRPDSTVLSDAIPLFYIGRNRNRLWVVREAEGRSGGIFLLKSSALRFAQQQSGPTGFATMMLTEPLELDIQNQGSRLAVPLGSVIDAARRRLPMTTNLLAMMGAEWRKLAAQVSRAIAGQRRNREALERELFRGRYTLLSKSDDDLPVDC